MTVAATVIGVRSMPIVVIQVDGDNLHVRAVAEELPGFPGGA